MACRRVIHSIETNGFTPICCLVKRRSCCVSGVDRFVMRTTLGRSRESFGLAIYCNASIDISSIVGTTGHFPVVTRERIM